MFVSGKNGFVMQLLINNVQKNGFQLLFGMIMIQNIISLLLPNYAATQTKTTQNRINGANIPHSRQSTNK